MSTEPQNLPNVVFFLRDRFSGKAWPNGCRFDSTSSPWWNPDILGKSVTEVLQQVLDLFGSRIGKNDNIVKDSIDKKQSP